MPYIKPERRVILNPMVCALTGQLLTDGEVNYVITRIIDDMYGRESYEVLSQGIGVLECVKQEFYRRRIIPYEQKKCQLNGEVYL